MSQEYKSAFKTCPPFDGSKAAYAAWLKKLSMWLALTDVPPEKQALLIIQNLGGAAEAIAINIDIPALKQGGEEDAAPEGIHGVKVPKGVKTLIAALNKGGYQATGPELSFQALDNWIDFRRQPGSSMTAFTTEFESRYRACKQQDITIPEAALAFLLLNRSGVPDEDRPGILASFKGTDDITLSAMQTRLNFSYGDRSLQHKGAQEVFEEHAEEDDVYEETDVMEWDDQAQVFVARRLMLPSGGRRPGPRRNFDVSRVRCFACGQLGHIRSSCPNKSPFGNSKGRPFDYDCLRLSQSPHDSFESMSVFYAQSTFTPVAILDSGCTMSVTGSTWLNNFAKELAETTGEKIVFEPTTTVLCFGRDVRSSSKRAIIPVWIAGKHGRIPVEVVEDLDGEPSLPLLLSKSAMAKLKIKVDYATSNAEVLGQSTKLLTNRRGHFVINLLELGENPTASDVFVSTSRCLTKKEIVQLHKRFGHPGADRLTMTLIKSGFERQECQDLVESVTKECEVCLKNGRPSAKPIVSSPLSSDFNEVVSIDIGYFEQRPYLKIICTFSRFGMAVQLSDKNPRSIIAGLDASWITYFGPMRKLLVDPAGENTSDEFMRFCDAFGIEVLSTPAQAPFANGVVERFGETLAEAMRKLRCDQPSQDFQQLLNKAVLAHNSLVNNLGFTPLQIVTGKNPNIPSTTTSNIAALEDSWHSSQDSFLPRLQSLHAARQAFIQAESSERVRRALRSNIRNDAPPKVEIGSSVFFWNDDTSKSARGFRGPGKVIGFDDGAHEVLIKYGGRIFSRHRSRIRLISQPATVASSDPAVPAPKPIIVDDDSDDECTPPLPPSTPIPTEIPVDLSPISRNSDIPTPRVLFPGDESGSGSIHMEGEGGEKFDEVPSESVSSEDEDPMDQTYQPSESESVMEQSMVCVSSVREKFGQVVPIFVATETENAQPPNSGVSSAEQNSPHFLDAKQKELESFRANGVFKRVNIKDLPRTVQVIDTKWVCSWKQVSDEVRMPKARLVAKGFQEQVNPEESIDAPTATREGVRLVAFTAAQNGWRLGSIDIKTAFLQANERSAEDKEIAVRPPPEAKEDRNVVWVLVKSMYGLRSAPKDWWKTLSQALVSEFHFRQCMNDQAVFTLSREGKLAGTLAVHVDDILFTGTEELIKVLDAVRKRFAFGSERFDHFVHLGVEFKSDCNRKRVQLGQESYIATLSPVDFGPSRMAKTDEALSPQEQQQLRALVGGIMWVATMTRPDVAVDASMIAGKLHQPIVQDVLTANKILRYLKGSASTTMVYQQLRQPLRVLAFADSAFQNLPQGRSQAGYLIMIAEEDDGRSQAVVIPGEDGERMMRDINGAVMCWKSSRHKRVIRSTFSAELLAHTNAFDTACWFANLFEEVSTGQLINHRNVPLDTRTDCKSLEDSTRSLRIQATEKRLYNEIWALREALETGEIRSLCHIPTSLMVADGLTKIQPKLRSRITSAMQGRVSLPI